MNMTIKIRDKQGATIASIGIYELLSMAQVYGAQAMFPVNECDVYLCDSDTGNKIEDCKLVEKPKWFDELELETAQNVKQGALDHVT